jgi:hypothetical protein
MNKEEEAELKRRVDILWRGMYGDDENEKTGVVDDVKEFKGYKKYFYMAMGALFTIQMVYWIIKELHIKIF